MNYFGARLALGVAVGVLGIAISSGMAVDSGVDVLANRTYIHRDSKTVLRVPLNWGEKLQDPYRLRKTTTSSVLSIDKLDPRISVTVIWSPLGARPWNEIIRAAEEDELGEEYGLLLAVYGKTKVSRPTTFKAGPFTVFKILLDDGPEGPSRSAGAVYLFEAGPITNRWKVKVRAVFPQINREEYIKQVEELVSQFSYANDKGS
jgi:hypothetical protein